MRVSEWEWVLRFCILPLCLMLSHRKMFILVSFKVFKIFFTFLCRRKKWHTIVCRFSIFSQRGFQLLQSCHEKLIEWFYSDDGSSMNGRNWWATTGSVPWTVLAALIMIMLLVLFLTPELDSFLALAAHIKRDSSHGAFLCSLNAFHMLCRGCPQDILESHSVFAHCSKDVLKSNNFTNEATSPCIKCYSGNS